MAYKDFIPQNIAPLGTKRIDIYDVNNNQVGHIPLGSLTPPPIKQKKYSFGAVSDIHLCNNDEDYDTSKEDFQRALRFFNNEENVNFICVCGDMTVNGCYKGNEHEFELYRKNVADYSPNTTVYAISGNHDAPYNDPKVVTTEADTVGRKDEELIPYTGRGLYYSFTHGDDVFIMVGEWAWSYHCSFSTPEMQWLYETLEANRNKRCFVFQHLLSFAGSGNPYGAIDGPNKDVTTDILESGANTSGKVFLSLMRHYKNCIWFHGHSHSDFGCQVDNPMANYDQVLGIHSVHIPSLATTRTWNVETGEYDKHDEGSSQGYVVDVYENGIHLRGRDFENGEFLPIASYWLDTALQTIPARTYTDSTNMIKP